MRSDTVTKGVQQAPHRSLFNALGMTQEELDRPLIGVVSSYNEIVPGHMNLDKITEAVKMGVAMAGGTPIVVPAIAVCDGIAMGHIGMKYSLVTRDLIADSTEALAMAHQFDGLVMIPNCDKNVPGLLMAAARVNIPTIFVSGGPMLAGHVKGGRTSLSSMFEAVGAHAAGKITDEDLCEYENKACPTCGSCSGMYTANSMNCLTEALGMGLRGNGTIPAVYSARLQLAKHAGMQVNFLEKARENKQIGRLIVSRSGSYDTNMKCIISEFTFTDKGGEPGDVYYSLKLKEYRDYSPEVVSIVTTPAAPGPEATIVAAEAETTRAVEEPVLRVGAAVVVNGDYCYDSYGGKPHKTANNISTTVTRIVSGNPYPIHVGSYGWVQESQIQITG